MIAIERVLTLTVQIRNTMMTKVTMVAASNASDAENFEFVNVNGSNLKVKTNVPMDINECVSWFT